MFNILKQHVMVFIGDNIGWPATSSIKSKNNHYKFILCKHFIFNHILWFVDSILQINLPVSRARGVSVQLVLSFEQLLLSITNHSCSIMLFIYQISYIINCLPGSCWNCLQLLSWHLFLPPFQSAKLLVLPLTWHTTFVRFSRHKRSPAPTHAQTRSDWWRAPADSRQFSQLSSRACCVFSLWKRFLSEIFTYLSQRRNYSHFRDKHGTKGLYGGKG